MKFTRGDTYKFKFQRKDANDEVIMTKSQKVWFTIKRNYNTSTNLVQKTLDDGITFTNDDGYYHVEIKPEDTSSLRYGKYVCDIQVENNEVVSTILKDKVELTKEVTFEYTKGE